MSECIFCQIRDGKIPTQLLYEDDEFIAFHDLYPVAPIHFLIVPKCHIASLLVVEEADAGWLGRLLLLAKQLACQNGLTTGFKTTINTGRGGGQEIFHLHCHVMGDKAIQAN